MVSACLTLYARRRCDEFCPSVRGSREGGGTYIALASCFPAWHAFGFPPGFSLVTVWEARVLLPRAFERRRDEREYHAGDEVGHGYHASCATIRAPPMGREVPDG